MRLLKGPSIIGLHGAFAADYHQPAEGRAALYLLGTDVLSVDEEDPSYDFSAPQPQIDAEAPPPFDSYADPGYDPAAAFTSPEGYVPAEADPAAWELDADSYQGFPDGAGVPVSTDAWNAFFDNAEGDMSNWDDLSQAADGGGGDGGGGDGGGGDGGGGGGGGYGPAPTPPAADTGSPVEQGAPAALSNLMKGAIVNLKQYSVAAPQPPQLSAGNMNLRPVAASSSAARGAATATKPRIAPVPAATVTSFAPPPRPAAAPRPAGAALFRR